MKLSMESLIATEQSQRTECPSCNKTFTDEGIRYMLGITSDLNLIHYALANYSGCDLIHGGHGETKFNPRTIESLIDDLIARTSTCPVCDQRVWDHEWHQRRRKYPVHWNNGTGECCPQLHLALPPKPSLFIRFLKWIAR